MTDLEQLGPPLAQHGEGPVWDDRSGRLVMVDIAAGEVLNVDVSTGAVTSRVRVGDTVGAVRLRRDGGLVAGADRGFVLVSADGVVGPPEPVWSDDSVRMNDGTCDPEGAFWCGSMAKDSAPGRGSLWRMTPDGRTTEVLRDVTVSNGIAFRDDGATAFYIDSPTRRVDLLHVQAGEVVAREPWAQVEIGDGVPDGLCRDAEGGVWVAVHEGSAVVHVDADGRLDEVVPVPVSRVTACTFGGPDLDVLFVTTSRLGPSPEAAAGAVFALRPGMHGLPARRYAG